MPWVNVREPYATAPRRNEPDATRTLTTDDIDVIGACAHVSDGVLDDAELLASYPEANLDSLLARRVSIGDDGPEIDANRTIFESCDLSRARFRGVRLSRILDSKLAGTDFSGAQLTDVRFERCILHLTQFRMAKFERVEFVDCQLREVDAFELDAKHVSFSGSELERVNIDRLKANRVDLRGARSLSFEGVGSLDGCIIAEHQLHALAYDLAFAAGLGIERATGSG